MKGQKGRNSCQSSMGESVKQLSKEFEGHKKVYKVFSLLRRTSKKKILLQSVKP